MDIQNTQEPDVAAVAEAEQAPASLPRQTQVLIGAVVVAGLIPAAFVGDVVAKALAISSGTGGPIFSIILVAITAIVLAALGGAALALTTKWPQRGALAAGAVAVGLAGLSIWMFIAVEAAREGLFVFVVTSVVLAVVTLVFKLVGGR